jgi:hypothetical protein
MSSSLALTLNTSQHQAESLQALQLLFSEACNSLAPIVRETRCWNRVALHHLTYKGLRERFPQLGSQMVCNAIYSVSRSARIVYQHPQSPWNAARDPAKSLPLLRFLPAAPVYFDRHTLSLKSGQLSLFTLDGRMRFKLDLSAADELQFQNSKLREIVLTRNADRFLLQFQFADALDLPEPGTLAWTDLPEYLVVFPDVACGTSASLPLTQENALA